MLKKKGLKMRWIVVVRENFSVKKGLTENKQLKLH